MVVVSLTDARSGRRGRGECVPYARYGESVEGVVAEIEAVAPLLASGRLDRQELQTAMHPGAARNALDCAFWDLEAKERGRSVWEIAGLDRPGELTTAETVITSYSIHYMKLYEPRRLHPLRRRHLALRSRARDGAALPRRGTPAPLPRVRTGGGVRRAVPRSDSGSYNFI